MNYSWFDPSLWVRKQSLRCSHFRDDDLLVVDSDLANLRRGRELLKSQHWHPNFKKACKFSKGYQTNKEKK